MAKKKAATKPKKKKTATPGKVSRTHTIAKAAGKGSDKRVIVYVPLADLRPSAYNPRTMSKDGVRKLTKSIKAFGQVAPLIVNRKNGIIGGHQRYTVMQELGFVNAACIVVDLPPAKEKALNLALNKIAGDWDLPALGAMLTGLEGEAFDDLEITGFDAAEIKKLTMPAAPPEPPLERVRTTIECPKCGHKW